MGWFKIVFMIFIYYQQLPTRSLGIIFNSEPCFKNTFPDVYWSDTPVPAFVIIALVAGFTLNYSLLNHSITSSATYLTTALNGASYGTLFSLSFIFTILFWMPDLDLMYLLSWMSPYFTYKTYYY